MTDKRRRHNNGRKWGDIWLPTSPWPRRPTLSTFIFSFLTRQVTSKWRILSAESIDELNKFKILFCTTNNPRESRLFFVCANIILMVANMVYVTKKQKRYCIQGWGLRRAKGNTTIKQRQGRDGGYVGGGDRWVVIIHQCCVRVLHPCTQLTLCILLLPVILADRGTRPRAYITGETKQM